MLRNRSAKGKAGIIASITAGITFIIALCFAAVRFAWTDFVIAILANIGYDLLKLLSGLPANLWLFVIGAIIVVGSVSSCIFYWRRAGSLRAERDSLHVERDSLNQVVARMNSMVDRINNMFTLDDRLLRSLPILLRAQDQKNELRKLLKDLLMAAIVTGAFTWDVQRGSILLPDVQREYLTVLEHYQMPAESIARTKFYIAKENQNHIQRGIAGEAFLDGRFRVVHIAHRGSTWKADCEGYIDFRERSSPPSYSSFVAVPVMVPKLVSEYPEKYVDECIAVICFDSANPTVFDSEEAQLLLKVFARRVAVIVLAYQAG